MQYVVCCGDLIPRLPPPVRTPNDVVNNHNYHVSNAGTVTFSVTAPAGAGSHTFAYALSDDNNCGGNVGSVHTTTGDSDPTPLAVVVNAPAAPDVPALFRQPFWWTARSRSGNDPDSGNATPVWALDAFSRHIRVWNSTVSGYYCGQADDTGTFVTTGPLSPQNGRGDSGRYHRQA